MDEAEEAKHRPAAKDRHTAGAPKLINKPISQAINDSVTFSSFWFT